MIGEPFAGDSAVGPMNILVHATLDRAPDPSRVAAAADASHATSVSQATSATQAIDRARFDALVVREFDFVWRSLRRLGVAQSEVADAAQQVWIVVARKLETIEVEHERSFVYGTVVRVASNVRRTRARRTRVFEEGTELETADPALPADVLVEEREARALLDEALMALPDDVREVFVLFECEELSSVEIAAILSLPVGTVSSRLRRAREEFHAIARRMRAKLDLGRTR